MEVFSGKWLTPDNTRMTVTISAISVMRSHLINVAVSTRPGVYVFEELTIVRKHLQLAISQHA